MTLGNAATQLGVSVRTLRRWIKDGAPHTKVGRTYDVDPEALTQWSTEVDRTTVVPYEPDSTAAELAHQLQQARVEKTQAEAALAAMRRDLQAGELVVVAELRAKEGRRISVVRDGLLSLPTRLPPRLEGLPRADMRDVILSEVTRLLNIYAGNREHAG